MISFILNIIFLITIIVMIIMWPRTVTIKDHLPKVNNPKYNWMQLQNEGCKYVTVKDNEVILKIVKTKANSK